MDLSRIEIMAILCLMVLAMAVVADSSPNDFVNTHNIARAELGLAPMVWNHTVAAFARNYGKKLAAICSLKHSSGPYGENLYWTSAKTVTAATAVQAWVSEKQYYDYMNNSCVAGQMCGHYTQIVWRKSVRLGCAKVKCHNKQTMVTCNYDPPGNYQGEKPY